MGMIQEGIGAMQRLPGWFPAHILPACPSHTRSDYLTDCCP